MPSVSPECLFLPLVLIPERVYLPVKLRPERAYLPVVLIPERAYLPFVLIPERRDGGVQFCRHANPVVCHFRLPFVCARLSESAFPPVSTGSMDGGAPR